MGFFAQGNSAYLAAYILIRFQLSGFGVESKEHPAGRSDKSYGCVCCERYVVRLRKLDSLGRRELCSLGKAAVLVTNNGDSSRLAVRGPAYSRGRYDLESLLI